MVNECVPIDGQGSVGDLVVKDAAETVTMDKVTSTRCPHDYLGYSCRICYSPQAVNDNPRSGMDVIAKLRDIQETKGYKGCLVLTLDAPHPNLSEYYDDGGFSV